MNTESSLPISQTAARTASRLAAGIGLAALVGWVLHLHLAQQVSPGWIAMHPLTAAGVVAASVSLALLQPRNAPNRRKIIGRFLAGAVTAFGAFQLLSICAGHDLTRALLPHPSAGGEIVEDIIPRTCVNLILLGASLLLLNFRSRRGYQLSELMSGLVAVIAILSLVAHCHDLVGYYTTSSYVPAALLTSTSVLILATGILLARAEHGTLGIVVSNTAGGVLARRLVPLAVVLPILLSALRIAGEKAGLFNAAFGMANSATAFIVLFLVAIWWTARLLFRIDTDRMRAEASRHENEERVRQLKIEKIAAEKASQAKDAFLAVLSHELRTPLTPALAAASYLADNADLPAEVHEELETVRRNVQLEARLIDDLLDLTRITRGKIELHLETVDAHELLRNALEIVRADIAAKQLTLTSDFHAPRHHLRADPVRLQQVFWNLVNNAVKFTAGPGRIALRSWNEESQFVFEITDTGIGIESEQQARIFDAFEQGERSITRQFGGLGLGLTISKTLLALHGGTLSVRSEGRDRGAAFRVTLEALPVAESTRAKSVSAVAGSSRKLHLLVVDDHPETLRMIARLLGRRGHTVFTADCVKNALKLLDEAKVDALISDIGLPDGSGYELMRQAKERYALRGIAISGFGMEEDIQRSMEAGFDRHLTKPVDFQDLEKTLQVLPLQNA